MSMQRPYLILAKCFSWYAALTLVAAFVYLIVSAILFAPHTEWLNPWTLRVLRMYGEDQVYLDVVQRLLNSDNFWLYFSQELASVVNIFLMASLWQQTSHLLRYIAMGSFLKSPSIVILKRIAFILTASFALDAMYSALSSSLYDVILATLQGQNLNRADIVTSILDSAMSDYANPIDFLATLVPNLQGSIKVVLAAVAVFASKSVKYAVAMDKELEELRNEQSLVV